MATSPNQRPPRSFRLVLGAQGEEEVARWYSNRGYRVVARNWRCRNGELDLVATRAGVVAFCEVKTRSTGRYGTGMEAVTKAKQRRLRQLALVWLGSSSVGYRQLRFDVASVDEGVVNVLEGAF